MSAWLVGIVTILYAGVCVSLFLEGNKPMAMVFFGYTIANIGLLFSF